MARYLRWQAHLGVVGSLSVASLASAQLAPRLGVEQRGDVVLIGNTLAHNCADEIPAPLVGNVGACGGDSDDSGADVLWSLGEEGQGPPLASTAVSPGEASSLSVLALPDGAAVTHARLYWSAMEGDGDRTLATLGRPGAELSVEADATVTFEEDGASFYQSSADVTELVRAGGAGAYRVSGVDVADPVGLEHTAHYAAWWLVVLYAQDTEPVRHLGVYDGLVRVGDAASATLSGFEIPPGPVDARLGVIAYEGDGTLDGDRLLVGAAAPLGDADAVGVVDNFFDGSRRGISGEPLAAPGDLPETSGAPDSLSGLDLHVVDLSGVLAPGQTSAEVLASTDNDSFVLAGLVLSAVTAAPDLSLSTERAVDVNGPPLRPGDELEYTVEINNSGTGAAARVTLRAALPPGVSLVPGSLTLASASGELPLTDAVDGDAGELESGDVLVVRLGADEAGGGALEVGETRAVRSRVTLDAGAAGSLISQAELLATTAAGAVTSRARGDADLASPGVSPIQLVIDGCGSDDDCGATSPRCDLAAAPTRCVQCLSDADCPGLAPACDESQACVCRPSLPEEGSCDGKDDDCDGQVDEGLVELPCELTVGTCRRTGRFVCDLGGEVRCAPDPLGPEVCGNGLDDDCDADVDADDADCDGLQPLDGAAPGPIAPPAVQPSSARTPASSLGPPAAALEPDDSNAGSSFRGGASCGLAPGTELAPRLWLPLALGLGWARRRRARALRSAAGARLGRARRRRAR